MKRTQFIRDWLHMAEKAKRDKWAWAGALLFVFGLVGVDSFILYSGVISEQQNTASADTLFFILPEISEVPHFAGWCVAGAALFFSFASRFFYRVKNPPWRLIQGALIYAITVCWVQLGFLLDGWKDAGYYFCLIAIIVIMYGGKENNHAT